MWLKLWEYSYLNDLLKFVVFRYWEEKGCPKPCLWCRVWWREPGPENAKKKRNHSRFSFRKPVSAFIHYQNKIYMVMEEITTFCFLFYKISDFFKWKFEMNDKNYISYKHIVGPIVELLTGLICPHYLHTQSTCFQS